MNNAGVTSARIVLGIVAATALWACTATVPHTLELKSAIPANYVEVSDQLVTSGRLSAAQLMSLDPLEYRMVINLAPGDGDSGIPSEAHLLTSRGIAYVAIPVKIEWPDYRDFVLFSGALDAVGTDRVWVHCRINYRASIFVFLYRVIHQAADPDRAYEKVTQVWVPSPVWLRFARETLAKHNIDYDF